MYCRGCGSELWETKVFCDMGSLPLANRLLDKEDLEKPEVHYPHRTLICERCLLVQMPNLPAETIFTDDYPFFSGQTSTWYGHCSRFADEAASRLGLGPTSRVLEIGSNDGTMLRRFRGLGIPAVGVEPCKSVAQHANMEGLATLQGFWNTKAARDLRQTQGISTSKSWKADLVIANNVLAHVPDIQEFLTAARMILAPGGVLSIEVAYLGSLVQHLQFDQLYAEHYSYFSISSLCKALERVGLRPLDVSFLPTHGGSIRLTAGLNGKQTPHLVKQRQKEAESDWHCMSGLRAFGPVVRTLRSELVNIVRQEGPGVGYGASAKANLLLAYLGLTPDDIEMVIDTTPSKWGKYTPGTHIPIKGPTQLREQKPDLLYNFLWNWRRESEANIRYYYHGPIVYLRS